MNIETVSMNLIAHSGEARRLAFKALEKAMHGEYAVAEKLLEECEIEINLSHQGQTELLINEAKGEKTPVNVLLIHAQDHLMTCMLAIDLIKEMIKLYKKISEQ